MGAQHTPLHGISSSSPPLEPGPRAVRGPVQNQFVVAPTEGLTHLANKAALFIYDLKAFCTCGKF